MFFLLYTMSIFLEMFLLPGNVPKLIYFKAQIQHLKQQQGAR